MTEIENFDPNMSVDKNGNTALHFLLQQDTQSQGVRQMIRALLKLRNTNIYSTNNEKRIPIFLAKNGPSAGSNVCARKNYNINIRDINGQSVFEYAIDQPIEKWTLS
ncbi:MAG: hypothetical protein HWD59_06010 [Coxiellaceae bacterium]|nr:MAG: hypothetical protein HWD59_06010 [Coxiellaceae bacterium]